MSTPRFVDGRIVGPEQTRALGSSMSGPDALSRSGINSLPSAGSTQGISRMQSMGNALGTMFGRAAADPRNPLNSLQQAKRRVPPRANITTSQVPANRGSISSLVDKGVSNMRTNQGSTLMEPDAMPNVVPSAPTMNANANRDRATLQGLTNVDLGRVNTEVKQGSASVGNQIMGMVSNAYAEVMGKLPSSAEIQAITKNAIDKFKSVDTRLKQTSADISNLAVAAVRSAVNDRASSARADTVGMDPYTAEDNMGPNILNKGSSEYRIKQMLNNAIPKEQSAGGINSLGRMRQDPRKFDTPPTQSPPRVFMEDGSEIGSDGRLPQPVKAVPKTDAGMMTGPEGAVPDSMATPLPDAVMDPTDSELNAGMDQSTDTAKEESKSIMDFANMGMVEFGLRMAASGSPTALGAAAQAGKEMIEANAIREERKADRDFKTSMQKMSQDFTRAEGDKNRKLKENEINATFEDRKARLKITAAELGLSEKLTDAKIKNMTAEHKLALETLGVSKEKLMTTELGQRRSLVQSLLKSTSDYVTASLKSNYQFNQLPPDQATLKVKNLFYARLKDGMNHDSVKALLQSPEAIKLTDDFANKQFGGKGGANIAGSYSADGGLTMRK
tara:strand:- start:715 stop:2559 length:1845 start_codon:yes stop_codon:yes gene_type:complete